MGGCTRRAARGTHRTCARNALGRDHRGPLSLDGEPERRGLGAVHARPGESCADRAGLDPRAEGAHNERIAALSGDTTVTAAVQSGGGRVFYQKRPSGADNFKLFVRQGLGGAERLLVDPTTIKIDGRHVSIDWWSASPDGRYVAYGQSPAGSEMATTHVIDVDSGQLLPENRADAVHQCDMAARQFRILLHETRRGREGGSTDLFRDMVACLHLLRTDPKSDRTVLTRGLYPTVPMEPFEIPILSADPTSSYVVALTAGGVRRENPLYTARVDDVRRAGRTWRKACELADEVVGLAIRGDELYLLSTRDAPNARVLRTSIANPSFAGATVVVPEGKTVVEGITAARDGLYVRIWTAATARCAGSAATASSRPPCFRSRARSSVRMRTGWKTARGCLPRAGSSPITVLRYDPATGRAADTGLSPRPPVDTSRFEAIKTFATARDGTKVPLSIIARRGLKRDGSNPTLVNAYGSYQITYTPGFNVRGIAFLEQGGVLAVAHVRGGGEYGRRWWKAGQKLAKPNTWRDLIDCCEALVREGWTSPATWRSRAARRAASPSDAP